MISYSEYERFDALGLSALVASREVEPREVIEAAISRIEAVNPRLNAVVQKLYDRARADVAREHPAGPFRGVPFLLKDLLALLQGTCTTNGCRMYLGQIAPRDSELVRRHRAAGLVVVGKTNTPEMGILPVTESSLHGPARNPWGLAHTPGGSSGGSAAAVAAGIVPMAHGNDGGGSIRIPAACCGLFGLKPTRGRNPLGPFVGEGWHGMVVEHAVTRSVRDSAALLDATQGPDVGAPYVAPAPERPFLEETKREPGRLRIALTVDSLLGRSVHPDCVAAAHDAAKLCASLGHTVEEAKPPVDAHVLTRAWLTLVAAETAAEIELVSRLTPKKPRASDFEPGTWMLAQAGRAFRADELAMAVHEIRATGRAVAAFFGKFDLLLTPTMGAPPLEIGALDPKPADLAVLAALRAVPNATAIRKVLDSLADRAFEFAAFTPIANATGQPAMSVPLYWNAAGLPIGVHFMARYGDEATLFRLAAQLEQARPWARKRPSL
ncbi:MAG: amidase [Myxococcales bacterium]